MSRIGKKNIKIPNGIEINLKNDKISCKGPKGNLNYTIPGNINVNIENQYITVKENYSNKNLKPLYGLTRTLINNLIIGVTKGFSKKLELQGVGYRSQVEGKNLILNVGYSHPIKIEPPEGISFQVENNTNITVLGIDKQTVGQLAAQIRSVRPPEPYKGKGIRYLGENVKRKVGKTGKK